MAALVRHAWSQKSIEPVCDQLRTSFEPDSVIDFGFYDATAQHRAAKCCRAEVCFEARWRCSHAAKKRRLFSFADLLAWFRKRRPYKALLISDEQQLQRLSWLGLLYTTWLEFYAWDVEAKVTGPLCAGCVEGSSIWISTYLWSPYGIGQAIIFLPCGFFFYLSFFFFLA